MSSKEVIRFVPFINRNRFQINLTVEVDQDMVPGTFYDIDSVVSHIEHWVKSSIPHYNPVVSINTANRTDAKMVALKRFFEQENVDHPSLLPVKAPFIPEGVHRFSSGKDTYWTFSVSTPSLADPISSMELCEFLNDYGMENEVPFHDKYRDGHYPDGTTAMSMMELYCQLTCASRFHASVWEERGYSRRK